MFPNAAAIAPHLEYPQTGITSRFCSELAEQLKCYVVAGYPEKLLSAETTNNSLIGANSAILYDPTGQYVGGYRKTHLFHVDKTWAIPGERPSLLVFNFYETFRRLRVRHFPVAFTTIQCLAWYMYGFKPANRELDLGRRAVRTS